MTSPSNLVPWMHVTVDCREKKYRHIDMKPCRKCQNHQTKTLLNLDVFVQRCPPRLRHKMSLLCSRTCNLAWEVFNRRGSILSLQMYCTTTIHHSSSFFSVPQQKLFIPPFLEECLLWRRKLSSPLNIAAILVARSAVGKLTFECRKSCWKLSPLHKYLLHICPY